VRVTVYHATEHAGHGPPVLIEGAVVDRAAGTAARLAAGRGGRIDDVGGRAGGFKGIPHLRGLQAFLESQDVGVGAVLQRAVDEVEKRLPVESDAVVVELLATLHGENGEPVDGIADQWVQAAEEELGGGSGREEL
jgi:hypothetical protein